MKLKEVNINSDSSKIFRQYLEVVKIFQPFNKLKRQEIRVLAELLKLEYSLKTVEEENKWKLIFHYDNRLLIRNNLNISVASFNNSLSALRKNNIVVNNIIPSKYLIDFDKGYSLKINFKIANK